jgi:PAS domain-containing protein
MESRRVSSILHEQLTSAFSAAHRAAFGNADSPGPDPDPMLSVPVRLIPLVQAARALRQALQEESDAHAMLQALVELSGDALLAMDVERRIIFANAAARQLLLRDGAFRHDADRLHLADPQEDRLLETALRSLDAADDALGGIDQLARVTRRSGSSCFLLRLRRRVEQPA